MEKASLKKFAVDARRKLIDDVKFQLGLYGITENGILEPQTGTDSALIFDLGNGNTQTIKGERYVKQYRNLVEHLRGFYGAANTKQQLDQFAEEMAYTWFNRLIAIRFMEVNRYIPVRVLSSEIKGQNLPDLVKSPFSGDLEFDENEKQQIFALQDANKEDDLFRFLFFKQCNDLNRILPYLFENLNGDDSFSELLVVLSFNDPNGVVYRLVHEIDEAWFDIHAKDDDGNPVGQVQVIGWLYQYYNTEPKKQVFADLDDNIKISKENIPAATQLFTPDWIVRYMVENSLGRLWYEGHPDFDKSEWKYYLDEAQQEPQVAQQLAEIRARYANIEPEQLKVIDPCMGSGHILCYLFDVLMQIYLDNGYSRREAVRSILEKNLFGLDIDKRAMQIAYFAVMMKGRGYNRRFLRGRDGKLEPKVYAIAESNEINRNHLKFFGTHLSDMERNLAVMQIEGLLDTFKDAREYGSILNVDACDWDVLERFVEDLGTAGQISFESVGSEETQESLRKLVRVAQNLGQKYDAVVTNPPYMGASNMNTTLSKFIKDNYADYKSDFFSAFIVKCSMLAKKQGYLGFLTPYVWMFIQSYEKLRQYLFTQATIETLIQFEYSAFEEATVPICTFVFKNAYVDKKGCYLRLTEFRGGMEVQRQKALEAIYNHECGFYYEQDARQYSKIPGSPVAYWFSKSIFEIFKNQTLANVGELAQGLITGSTEKFTRIWYEVDRSRFIADAINGDMVKKLALKWVPYNKGGEFRKWYGNNDYVVNWENDGYEIKNFKDEKGKLRSRPQGSDYYFLPVITWTKISSSRIAFRYKEKGHISSEAGMVISVPSNKREYILGYLNSCVTQYILNALSPTLNYELGDIAKLPIIDNNDLEINEKVKACECIVKKDWDSFETSWDFKQHPLLRKYSSIAETFKLWENECDTRFNQLKSNEEELNSIFIDIYGLQDELTPEVEEKDITVRKADLSRDIRSFMSYAVGCMFGRYSLDDEGLIYAGGEWDNSRYKTFIPDEDNCIPITDEEYFSDDIVGRFVEFVKTVYGEDTLEENLDFIANALGNKGDTSREVIRNYFLKGFYVDHLKIYQKRPIYWLFDSGKQNGFKALIYMHRYDADTVGRVRTDYLHRAQKYVETAMQSAQYTIDNASSASEKSKATKAVTKYTKQLAEMKIYDEAIAHIANKRIEIDLDDGVKVNYEKFQGVEVAQEGKKALKVDLLAKLK